MCRAEMVAARSQAEEIGVLLVIGDHGMGYVDGRRCCLRRWRDGHFASATSAEHLSRIKRLNAFGR